MYADGNPAAVALFVHGAQGTTVQGVCVCVCVCKGACVCVYAYMRMFMYMCVLRDETVCMGVNI